MQASLFIVFSLWLCLYVLLPVFRDHRAPSLSPDALPAGFRAEVGSLLATLRDLEYDAQTGKLVAVDVDSMRAQLHTRLTEAIRWAGFEARFLGPDGQPRYDLLAPLEIE